MNAKIKAISYYLPDQVVSNEDISKKFPDWASAEQIGKKVGILNRHVVSINETSSDLAIKACEKLFFEHNLKKDLIDFVLLCTQSPDYALPTTACIVQDKLGLSTNCGALDFNLGCSGYVYGLALSKGLIQSKVANNILLITTETYSKYIDINDRGNQTIFGDAASATLISSEGDCSIEKFSIGSDGSGAENLIVKNSASKKENLSYDKDCKLYMNGPEIFNFTLSSVPNLVTETLNKNKLNFDDIDLFIFHQANKYMLNHLRKKIRIPEEKFYYFIKDVGNTVSSTIPIALYEAINEKKIKKGFKVLLAGFGVGYSWAGTIIKF
jgi:3-oxoacyl-[acyl-carrier-protein] synthase III